MAYDTQIHNPARFKPGVADTLIELGPLPIVMYVRHAVVDRVWLTLPDGVAAPPGAVRVTDGISDSQDSWDFSTLWSVPVSLLTFES
jgi:hypothetical protein